MPEARLLAPDTLFVQISPDVHTAPYWAAAREHRLSVPRCSDCKAFILPPTGYCPRCRCQSLDWVDLSGRGRVYTFTVVRHPPVPTLGQTVPYLIAVLELEGADGVKLVSNIVECDAADVDIGLEVEVVWTDHGDFVLPLFRPLQAP